MRAVVQRVKEAHVTVGEDRIAAIGNGLLILLGVEETDSDEDIDWLAARILSLRLFKGESGAWERNVAEAEGELLVVSQFTLFASTRKGTKPSWHRAAKPDVAAPICEEFTRRLRERRPGRVQAGRFGAMMDVSLVNDGPVTLLIDTRLRE